MSVDDAAPAHGRSAESDGEQRGGQSLLPRQRREEIRRRVVDEGFVRIEQLADALDVSLMTIHRDLDVLQTEGWLRKVRGGATARPSAVHHGDVRHRIATMSGAKRELARAAVELVDPGQSVLVDESTTALALVELLPGRAPLTVVSNFLPVVTRLGAEPGIDVICLGGAYYGAYDAFLGMRTSEAVRSLRADVMFASTTAVTGGQCYHQSQETVAVKRALMDAADRRVLLLDHSKFLQRGLHHLAPLTAFDLVLVDSGTPSSEVELLRGQGVAVEVAPALDRS